MTRGSIALMLSTIGMVALVVSPIPAANGTAAASGVAVADARSDTGGLSSDRAADVQAKGRYKKQGNACVWDANDGGPNQCTPSVKGRFKKGNNNSCTWDSTDVGADQCRPAKGRWKRGGDNSCAWDANDGGPDQCNPRRPRMRSER